ncbi:MAG: alpha/beta hydrolase [Candidatus Hodarchaeales archaeon]|jgi:pimeloyl-ACP methyl ester carboxylesterase
MPKAKANNIEIEYELFGNASDKPLLLVMGLGAQMIAWDVKFIQHLVDRGFYVIRFDNRDVGLSTKCEEAGAPNLMQAFATAQSGGTVESPYSLEDMADDAVGLLDVLNIEKAHICGASMGGMIVQVIALRHPTRVISLCSIMSTTGNPDLPPAKPEILQLLTTPVPPEREAYIENGIKAGKILYGSGFPYDEARGRELAGKAFDRCFYPPGFGRQLLAIMANGNRKPKLASVTVPTLVIHGGDDQLVPVEGGKDTHEAIPGSELIIIDGMGHSLPPETWTQITDAIKANAAKA